MMRSLLTGCGLLAMVAGASAADLPPQGMPYRAPYLAAYNWTGFYLGINGGGAWGRSNWNGMGISTDPSGGMIGLTAGYNWQGPGNPFVFGIEGDIDWSGVRGTSACGVSTCETKNTWLGTVRGRVGYAWDRILPYVTGGVAFGSIKTERTGFSGASDSNAGWTIGAGIEAAIAPNVSAKVEYLYASIGDTTCSVASCGVASNVDLRLNMLRAGLNYRF
jgi:outer membrane immunogenic protein